jgi:hypothetical protein
VMEERPVDQKHDRLALFTSRTPSSDGRRTPHTWRNPCYPVAGASPTLSATSRCCRPSS